ncbi:MAG: cobalamin-binding protein [Firmicutes bacterium HGW-Firmicutes-14]|nr:MAG: cobalamin-binding protein [Firmicutes bacterium HGW-Firmicutes-14]
MSLQDIYESVLTFKADNLVELIRKEIAKGTAVSDILQEGLIRAMDEVGRRFAEGEFFVPEMLRSAKTMKAGLEVLKPLLIKTNTKAAGNIVIGTVKGDLHDIGKNLVIIMLEGAGFKVVDLGIDVDNETFVRAAEENKADVVCLSALLSTTIQAMKGVIDAIRKEGLNCKMVVGGAPVTPDFAQEIGADGYSEDAARAVDIVRTLVERQ